MKVPRFMSSTLESMLREEIHTVGEINGLLTDEGRLDLVKRFVQCGLLKDQKI